jgi:hypothetical protein
MHIADGVKPHAFRCLRLAEEHRARLE